MDRSIEDARLNCPDGSSVPWFENGPLSVCLSSRTRTLFSDHLEQHVHDILGSAVAMVMDRKETVCLEHELQLKQLEPEHIRSHVYQLRLGNTHTHTHTQRHLCEVRVM